MGRCIVDALLTVDPRLGLAARWRRPADDGAGRRRLVFLCGGESREVEGRYMGAVASPARGHGWSGPFIILAIAAGLRYTPRLDYGVSWSQGDQFS